MDGISAAVVSSSRVEAWEIFSRAHPDEWASYRGGCQCPSCREYRRMFEEWFASGCK